MFICIYETALSLLQMECSFLHLCCLMHLLSCPLSTSITSHVGFTKALVITKCHFPE